MSEKTEIGRLYFKWLCDKIKLSSVPGNYNQLMRALFRSKFKAIVPNDGNRCEDALKLRERFIDEIGKTVGDYNNLTTTCNMLEILVALAERFDGMMLDECCEDRSYKWFWEMIRNTTLDEYTDEEYMNIGGLYGIDFILTRIIERTYAKDGNGGLFPLKRPDNDQRKLEIWYQMCAYLLENYHEQYFE